MKQVILHYNTGRLEVVEVPVPAVRKNTVLIKTSASLVSAGTERFLVDLARKNLLGKVIARPDLVRRVLDKVKTDGIAETFQQVRQRLDRPFPLGYSASGRVIAVGDGVTAFRVGDAVACGGAEVAVHADVICAPSTMISALPAGVQMDHGAFAMVGAIPLHAVRLAQLGSGESVAVIGLGLLGLLAVQILRSMGCRVIGFDVIPGKLDLASTFGAEVVADSADAGAVQVVDEWTRGKGVDVVLIAAGTPTNRPLELAAQISRVKGKVVAMGLVGLNVPRQHFYERELELIVSRSSGPGLYDPDYELHGKDYPHSYVRWTHARNMAEFLRLVSSAAVQVEPLITHRFPISDAVKAYSTLAGRDGESPIGIVLRYENNPSVLNETSVRMPVRRVEKAHPAGVGVGVIGAGLFARTVLLPEINRLREVRLIGVATRTGHNAHQVAASFGMKYATTDVRRILEDPEISSVVIATRHESHAELVIAALDAGKDVFVEKPLALTVEELARISTAWRESKRRLMVGFNRRHSPHSAAALRFIKGSAGPTLFHCRVNAGDVPSGSWVNDPSTGGDRIRGELCHFIDLATYIIDQAPVSAEAAGLPAKRDGSPREDVAVILTFGDGSIANIVYTARGHRSLPREWIEVFRGGRVVAIENFRVTRFYGAGAGRTHRTWRLDRGYTQELSEWFKALQKGQPAPVTYETYVTSTLATLRAAEALSAGTSSTISPIVIKSH